MRRKALTVLGFLTGLGAGTLLYRRGSRARTRRVDLYFQDGSMVSLADGNGGADRLLPLAERILREADGTTA